LGEAGEDSAACRVGYGLEGRGERVVVQRTVRRSSSRRS
jgi:hypothetical protein